MFSSPMTMYRRTGKGYNYYNKEIEGDVHNGTEDKKQEEGQN